MTSTPHMVTRLRTDDGRILWMHRLNDGLPIALAMARQGLSIPKLAARTVEVDPDGKGISYQLIGRLVTQGASARQTTSRRSAELIAAALSTPLSKLFSEHATAIVRTPRTSTVRGTRNDAA